jgi:electron transfer flavoprotein beta subunit
MPERHIAVCMKITPKPEEIRVDPETMFILREQARSEINPPDMNAIELALRLKDQSGARLSIISMGPPFFETHLRAGLAMGADELYLLSDRAFAGADTLATTYVLAMAVEKLGDVDLVVCGEESSDGATGQVPPGLAEWLDWPVVTLAVQASFEESPNSILVTRDSHGRSLVRCPLPAVLSVKSAANQPRFMDYDLKSWAFEEAPLTLWGSEDLGTEPARIGLTGSPTSVAGLREAETRERRRERLEGAPEAMARRLAEILDPFLRS